MFVQLYCLSCLMILTSILAGHFVVVCRGWKLYTKLNDAVTK